MEVTDSATFNIYLLQIRITSKIILVKNFARLKEKKLVDFLFYTIRNVMKKKQQTS